MSAYWNDVSGVIPSGGSAAALPADANRHGLFFANPSSHAMALVVGSTAIPIAAGEKLPLPMESKFCPSNSITITGTAGDSYSLATW